MAGMREQSEIDEADAPEVAKWSATCKRFFTMAVKDVDIKIANLSQCPVSLSFQKDVTAAVEKLRVRYEELAFYYIHLEGKMTEQQWAANYQAKVEEVEQLYKKAETAYSSAMAQAQAAQIQGQVRAPVAAGGGGGRGQPPTFKIEASFKPKQDLSDEMTLQEFKVFKEQFNTYKNISRLENASDDIQKAVLLSCISPEFQAKVDLSHAMTLEQSMVILEEVFRKANPRMLLRHRYLQMKQEKGESVSEYISKEALLSKDAGIAELTPEELRAHILIAGIHEKDLVRKLLEVKEEDLDVMKIRELADIYAEQTKTVEGLVDPDSAKTRQASADSKLTCFTCQGKGHRSPECKFPKEKLHCKYCQQYGRPANRHNSSQFCLKKCQEFAAKDKAKAKGKTVVTKEGNQVTKDDSHTPADKAEACRVVQHPVPAGGADSCDEDSREAAEASHFSQARQVKMPQVREVVMKHCSAEPRRSVPTPPLKLFVSAGPAMRSAPSISSVPDTGAEQSVAKLEVVKRLRLKILPTSTQLFSASGAKMSVEGEVIMYVRVTGGHVRKVIALVSSDLEDNFLLAWHDQVRCGILSESWPELPAEKRVQARQLNSHEVGQFDKVHDEDIKALLTEFDDRFHDELEESDRLCDVEVDIKLKEGVEPYMTNRTQRLDYHEMKPAYEAIKKAVEGGWIREHDPNKDKPIEWLFCGQVIPKPNSDPANPTYRLVADMSPLNDRVQRDTYHFKGPDQLWQSLSPDSNLWFVMDCTASFSQIKLSKDAQDIMVVSFPTPEGVKYYHYTVLTQGYCNSGPIFCRHSDKVLEGQPMHKGIDDVLVEGADKQEILIKLRQVLEAARKGNMTFSRKKIQFGDTVEFCGYQVTKDGMKPLPRKVLAIRDHPECQSVDDVRSFLGLLNQFSKFWPDLAHVAQPLRRLTRKGEEFNWGPVEKSCFSRLKSMMTDHMNLVAYDPNLLTKISHDGSGAGMGFCLQQFHPNAECWCKDREKKGGQQPKHDHKCFCRWRILWCGSKALRPSYRSLPAVYIEAITHHYALTTCSFYLKLTTEKFIAETDHQSLVQLTKKPLEELPDKLKNLFMDLRCFNYTTIYNPGLKLAISDCLSRSVHWEDGKHEENEEDDEFDSGVHRAILRQVISSGVSDYIWRDPLLKPIIDQAGKCSEYKQVLELLKTRATKQSVRHRVPSDHPARAYLPVWDRMGWERDEETGAEIMTVDTNRLVIPVQARKDICKKLHISHAGEKKTARAGVKRYFWPKMHEALTKQCQECDSCRENQQIQAAEPPPHQEDLASYPMEKMSTDLFHFGGNTYLILVDWFSAFPFVRNLGRTSSTLKVIRKLRKIFLAYGFCTKLKSDFGPEYRQTFQRWCDEVGIELVYSSSYNSSGNSRAEVQVKQVKKLLRKTQTSGEDFQLVLSEWRGCPSAEGPSSAQLFFGRAVRSMVLPELHTEVDPAADRERRRDQEERSREKRVTRQPLKVLSRDQKVWLLDRIKKKWDIPGRIRGARPSGRSYIVETRDGHLYLRNRRFIRPRLDEQHEGKESEAEHSSVTQESGTQHSNVTQENEVTTEGQNVLTEKEQVRSYAEVAGGVKGPVTRSRAKKGLVP